MKIPERTVVIGIGEPCPATDAVILEDDTCGVLAAPADLRHCHEHPIALYSSLHRFKPYPPGDLRRQGRTIYAMVVELESDPICTPGSIHNAATRLARHPLVDTAGSIRLQMLGCIHAGIEPLAGYSALTPLFEFLSQSGSRRLYLQVPAEHKPVISARVQQDTRRSRPVAVYRDFFQE